MAVYLSALLVLWSVARQYDRLEKTVESVSPPTATPLDYYDWR